MRPFFEFLVCYCFLHVHYVVLHPDAASHPAIRRIPAPPSAAIIFPPVALHLVTSWSRGGAAESGNCSVTRQPLAAQDLVDLQANAGITQNPRPCPRSRRNKKGLSR